MIASIVLPELGGGEKRQLMRSHSKNWRHARAFGVLLRSETDSQLSLHQGMNKSDGSALIAFPYLRTLPRRRQNQSEVHQHPSQSWTEYVAFPALAIQRSDSAAC